MIRTTRTAFRELPDGNFQCTVEVTVSRDVLATAGAGVAIALPGAPGNYGEEDASAEPETYSVELAIARADAATAQVRELCADKPPPQTIGAGGMNTEEFMSPNMLETWKHPAAKKIRLIFLHKPFQDFAREELKVTDPFAAAIPTAIRFMRESVAPANDVVEAQALLTKLVDDYEAWCELNKVAAWPEDVKQ